MTTPQKADLTEFFKLSRPKTPPCRLALTLAQLSESERVQFDAACEADANVITNQALSLWLERHAKDWTGGWQNCYSHRSRKCSCFRD